MVGCIQKKEDEIDIKNEDIITMENLDDYMFRDDVQYVDLRNFNSGFTNGFIKSFEVIPFFDYLDYRAFNRNDSYTFSPDQIINENIIYNLFEKDKAIFLFADGCVRSGYIKDLLSYLEYDMVFVLGGFYDYHGDNIVLGDGEFHFGDTFYNSLYDESSKLTYIVYGKFNLSLKIIEIRFDIIDENNTSLRNSFSEDSILLNNELTNLENYIVYDLLSLSDLYISLSNLDDSGYISVFELDSEITENLANVIYDFIPVK